MSRFYLFPSGEISPTGRGADGHGQKDLILSVLFQGFWNNTVYFYSLLVPNPDKPELKIED
jgi:hypothetical protein